MAEVTREHRHHALSINGKYDINKMHPDVRDWLDYGTRPTSTLSPAMVFVVELEQQAKAIADAEARGRAAERADAIAKLEADAAYAHSIGVSEVSRRSSEWACAMRNVLSGEAESFRLGEHVGAAGKDGG